MMTPAQKYRQLTRDLIAARKRLKDDTDESKEVVDILDAMDHVWYKELTEEDIKALKQRP